MISATLNPVDYKLPEVPLVSRFLIGQPASPGQDYAGRFIATGPNTKKVSSQDLRPGQLVFGRVDRPTKFGPLAEYIVTSRAGCVPVPEGVSPDHAAGVATAGMTAYQCIVPNVEPGQRVFINGGSGGTGTFGIQIAKVKGCFVVASCSTPNVDLCKSLGADKVIDYKKQDLAAELTRLGMFDLVVDNVGTPAELFWQARHFLKEGAKWVQPAAGFGLGDMRALAARSMWPKFLGGGTAKFEYLKVVNNYDQAMELGRWMQEGKVKAVVDEVFRMEDKGPVKAFEKMKTGRARGNERQECEASRVKLRAGTYPTPPCSAVSFRYFTYLKVPYVAQHKRQQNCTESTCHIDASNDHIAPLLVSLPPAPLVVHEMPVEPIGSPTTHNIH